MQVEMATGKNLKRVRVFIDKYGNKYEGSINENFERINMGGTPKTSGVATKTGETKETQNQ